MNQFIPGIFLIKIKNDEQADLKAIEFLTNIRDSIVKGDGTFAEYAKKYSEDKETKPFGGELGTFYLNQLDKNHAGYCFKHERRRYQLSQKN